MDHELVCRVCHGLCVVEVEIENVSSLSAEFAGKSVATCPLRGATSRLDGMLHHDVILLDAVVSWP